MEKRYRNKIIIIINYRTGILTIGTANLHRAPGRMWDSDGKTNHLNKLSVNPACLQLS